MVDLLRSTDDALALVPDGARLGVGGVLLQRKPVAFLGALAAAGRRDLRVHSFLASLEVELLAVHRSLAEAHTGYVGFEQLGFAPAYGAAVEAGAVRAVEYSEVLFVAGLRAALAGLPFLPVKGGAGSDVAAELGFAEVACPYTGQALIAVPATDLDVAVIHAEAADRDGNVLGPPPDRRSFLFDLDANVARAARQVVVTVERIATGDEVRAQPARTLLFGFEVAAVVHCPGGAAPTGLPGCYPPDLPAVRRYLQAVAADPTAAAAAMRALTATAPADRT